MHRTITRLGLSFMASWMLDAAGHKDDSKRRRCPSKERMDCAATPSIRVSNAGELGRLPRLLVTLPARGHRSGWRLLHRFAVHPRRDAGEPGWLDVAYSTNFFFFLTCRPKKAENQINEQRITDRTYSEPKLF